VQCKRDKLTQVSAMLVATLVCGGQCYRPYTVESAKGLSRARRVVDAMLLGLTLKISKQKNFL